MVPLMLWAALLSVPAAPADCTEQCAQEILQAARSFVSSRRYPARLQYNVRVTLRKADSTDEPQTYRSAYDAANNVVYVKSISVEETAHPVRATGTNLAIGFSLQGMELFRASLGRPASDPDILGVPLVTPTYSFGLGRGTISERAPSSSLREIGRVATKSAEYTASYRGVETIAGEPCLHVGLLPRTSTPRSRLRELWVAVADGAPLKAQVRGNFSTGPWNGIDWTITFKRFGEALYLDAEITDNPVRLSKAREGRVVVEFLDIAERDFHRDFLASIAPMRAAREP
jgi:hypothetical protein